MQSRVEVGSRHFFFTLFSYDADDDAGAIRILRLGEVPLRYNLNDLFLLHVDLVELDFVSLCQERAVIDLNKVLYLLNPILCLVAHQWVSRFNLLRVFEQF